MDKELQERGDDGRRPQGGGRRKGEGRGGKGRERGGEMGENKRAEKCTEGLQLAGHSKLSLVLRGERLHKPFTHHCATDDTAHCSSSYHGYADTPPLRMCSPVVSLFCMHQPHQIM